jgi:hypothetical protein
MNAAITYKDKFFNLRNAPAATDPQSSFAGKPASKDKSAIHNPQ